MSFSKLSSFGTPATANGPISDAANAFLVSTRGLYDSKEYSDFTLTCDGRLYRMHKSIVCPRSSVFAAMLRSSLQEGLNNSINLPDDDVLAVHCMVQYFYFIDYDPDHQCDEEGFERLNISESPQPEKAKATLDDTENTPPEPALKLHHALKLHAEVYVLADRYDVTALKSLALEKFKRSMRSQWNPDAFLEAAHIAYEWTSEADRGLRATILDGMFENRVKLLNDPRLREKLETLGWLTYGLAARMISPSSVQVKRCDSCSRIFS